MANYGWVESEESITSEFVSSVLEEMNKNLFKGNLQVNFSEESGHPSWHIQYVSRGKVWASRICWLKTPQRFEMRHGGGTSMDWWVDSAILNEIAVKVNGIIGDDGYDHHNKGEPHKFDTFEQFVQEYFAHVKNPIFRKFILSEEKKFTPEEFHNDLGVSPVAFSLRFKKS